MSDLTSSRTPRPPCGRWRSLQSCSVRAIGLGLFGLALAMTAGCGGPHYPTRNGALSRSSGGDDSPVADLGATTPANAAEPVEIVLAERSRALHPQGDDEASAQKRPLPAPRRPSAPRVQRNVNGTSLPSRFQLECNGSIIAQPVYLKKMYQTPNGRTVWMLTSSLDEKQPRTPAVFVRFETESDSPEILISKSWKARLFVQRTSRDPVYFTPPGGTAEIEFSAWDDNGVEGRVLPGELQASADGKLHAVEGKFLAGPATAPLTQGE